MVREIRIYVEGGGEGSHTKRMVREGFHHFLDTLVVKAREKRIEWNIIACGSRNNAYSGFQTALQIHPDSFNILLVDSESPVHGEPWEHLRNQDGWDIHREHSEHCHLMVEIFESWLLADTDALKEFYGKGFKTSALSGNPHVESISKRDVLTSLNNATLYTSRGEYDKIRHGPNILKRVDAPKVRASAPHCNRLFTTLAEKIGIPS